MALSSSVASRRAVFDGRQGRPRVLGVSVYQVCGSGGLDVNDGKGVGDDVVQFPGDAQPFLFDPSLGFLLPRAFCGRQLLKQQCEVRAPSAVRFGGQQPSLHRR